MDLATLIGFLGAAAMVVMAMLLGGGFGMFIDVPSILIVLVGSHFVVIMQFNLGQFFGGFKVGMKKQASNERAGAYIYQHGNMHAAQPIHASRSVPFSAGSR